MRYNNNIRVPWWELPFQMGQNQKQAKLRSSSPKPDETPVKDRRNSDV